MNSKILRTLKLSTLSQCFRNIHKFNAIKLNTYRSLISVKGTDSSKYLQGLLTNDIYHLHPVENRLMYSMILNNRGRVMFDVLVYQLKSDNQSDPHYLLEVDASKLQDAIKYLSIFRVKRKVEISNVQNDYDLYSIMNLSNNETDLLAPKNHENLLLSQLDPRVKSLGFRMLINKNLNSFKVSDIVDDCEEVSDLNLYKQFMYKHGVSENSDVISYGNSIPLEYNIVFLNGVCFNKGCYLGQELVAKTHHTGVIRKRIMPLELINDENIKFASDSDILNSKTGQSVGKLRNIIGKYGLALMRLAKIDNTSMVLVDSDGKQHQVKVHVPKFWELDEALMNEMKTSKLE